MNTKGQPKKIAVFASGEGSNAEILFKKFPGQVSLLVCNKKDAPVIAKATSNHVPVAVIDKDWHTTGKPLAALLNESNIDLIVCAGFLLKIPDDIVRAYQGRMINIHPSLLPKFGGKGMYGQRVHEAVLAAGEKESGITIHFVNEHYDEGKTILQKKCTIDAGETVDSLSRKIQALEHKYLTEVVAQLLNQSKIKSQESGE